MQIPIALNTTQSSNLFLRALWAEMRQVFGKCAWQYSPNKHGKNNRISFGQVDIGLTFNLLVSVTYKQKGVIHHINFEPHNTEKISKDIQKKLQSAISTALNTYESPKKFLLRTNFKSYPKQFAHYKGTNFIISPRAKVFNTLDINVVGFDQVDAEHEAQKIFNSILDFLSICTNAVCVIILSNDLPLPNHTPSKEVYFEEFDWIDSYPVLDNQLVLWQCQKVFIDKIVSGEAKTDAPLLNASRHFHAAQKLIANNQTEIPMELAVTLYVSALEVASTVYPFATTTCIECGQNIFSIRRRVKELTSKHLKKLEKFIDQYYSIRSKYLHAGIMTSNYNNGKSAIPLLDPNAYNGCLTGNYVPINLQEYASYILRQVFLETV